MSSGYDIIKMSDTQLNNLMGYVSESLTEEDFCKVVRHPALNKFKLQLSVDSYDKDMDLEEYITCEVLELNELNSMLEEVDTFNVSNDVLNVVENGVLFKASSRIQNTWAKDYFIVLALLGTDNNVYPMYTIDSKFKDLIHASDKEIAGLINVHLQSFFSIQYLLLNHKNIFSVTVQEDKKNTKPKSNKTKKPKKSKSNKKHKVRVYSISQSMDDEIESVGKELKTKRKGKMLRVCDAWGVRGHYRHLSSGKVVYVKPHVKGKNRDNYIEKEYELFKKEVW